MLHGPMLDNFNQLGVLQDLALEEDRVGDVNIVVGERDHQIFGRIGTLSNMLGKCLPNRGLHIIQKLTDDILYHRLVLPSQTLTVAVVEFDDGREQRRAALAGLVAGQIDELLRTDVVRRHLKCSIAASIIARMIDPKPFYKVNKLSADRSPAAVWVGLRVDMTSLRPRQQTARLPERSKIAIGGPRPHGARDKLLGRGQRFAAVTERLAEVL